MSTAKIFTPKGDVILIDAEDFSTLNSMPWFISNHGYVIMNRWRGRQFTPRTYRRCFHRVIMNAPDGTVVDHINGNTLDNRKINLRVCEQKENARNQRKRAQPGQSKFKGVGRSQRGTGWRAYIKNDYKYIHLGHFSSEVEAAKAYDAAAIMYFGSFARLNFPNDQEKEA